MSFAMSNGPRRGQIIILAPVGVVPRCVIAARWAFCLIALQVLATNAQVTTKAPPQPSKSNHHFADANNQIMSNAVDQQHESLGRTFAELLVAASTLTTTISATMRSQSDFATQTTPASTTPATLGRAPSQSRCEYLAGAQQPKRLRGKPLHLRFSGQNQAQRHMIRHQANLQVARNLDASNDDDYKQQASRDNKSATLIIHDASDNSTQLTGGEPRLRGAGSHRTSRDQLSLASVDVSIVNSDADISEWLYGSDLDISRSIASSGGNFSERQSSQPIRFKIAPASQSAAGITVPPLWRTHDVQAENYTIRRVVDEANIFAIRLLHQANRERLGNQNLVQPPFAIYKGLALLSSGALGETARELDRVLLGTQPHFDASKLTLEPDRHRLHSSFADVLQQLHSGAVNHKQSAHHYSQTDPGLINVREPVDANLAVGSAGSVAADAAVSQGSLSSPISFGDLASEQVNKFGERDSAPSSSGDNSIDEQQYLIVANNLLFSPQAYEISHDFKATLQQYHNETCLTRVETGSIEAIQVVNSWIRRATHGVVPAIMGKRDTFDEYNVMTLMVTTWLKQAWQDIFYRVSSSLRSNIRLKGQGRAMKFDRQQQQSFANSNINSINNNNNNNNDNNNIINSQQTSGFYSILRPGNLMEFVDDKKESHFVEYIVSRPTANIQHFRTQINGFTFELVSVPFLGSSHRFIALMPLSSPTANISTSQQITDSIQKILMEPLAIEDPIDPIILPISNNTNRLSNIHQQHLQHNPLPLYPTSQHNQASKDPANDTDSSLLTKFLTSFSEQPNKSLRLMWNLLAPELITWQVMKNIQSSRAQPDQQNMQSRTTYANANANANDQAESSNQQPGDLSLQMKSLAPLVQLSLPVIRSDLDASMVAALNHIGLVNAFDPSQANFIGINGHPFNYNELYLSSVLAKTTFNLDEHGVNHDRTIKSLEQLRAHPNRSQHGGAKLRLTKTKLIESSRRIDEIKFDKPFIWFTADIKTRLILMTGVVRNPSNVV